MSVKVRLIAVLSAIMVAAFLITGLVNYRVSRSAVRRELITSSLPLTRDTIYSEISASLVQPFYVSSTMASDAFLRNWAEGGERDQVVILRYLADLRRKFGFSSVFYVSARTSTYYHHDGILKRIGPQDAHDVWFYRFLDSGLESDLDVDTNEAAGNSLTVFINCRVTGAERGDPRRDGGRAGDGRRFRPAGADPGALPAAGLPGGPRGAHPGARRPLGHREGEHRRTARDARGRRAGARQPRPPGRPLLRRGHGPTLLTARYLPELDWFLLVEQDEEPALAASRRSLVNTLLIGLAASLVIVVAGAVTVSWFQSRMQLMAVTDDLTGAHNRRAFEEHFAGAQSRFARYRQPFSLILLDMDRFKQINDTWGHLAGDRALKTLAEIVRRQIRPTDVISRWGGDEFAVLVECGLPEALDVANRIRALVSRELHEYSSTVSAGVAEHREDDTLDTLIRRADRALYSAKDTGRDAVVGEALV